VRVELKLRQANQVVKKSIFGPMDEYTHFLTYRHWRLIRDPITTEFERQLVIKNLQPVILIEYNREVYQSKQKSDLRITFDHNVKSANSTTLFPMKPFYKQFIPRFVVLEIKLINSPPVWLEKLIRRQGLKVIANSKYTQCLQIARHNLYHPEKVIIER